MRLVEWHWKEEPSVEKRQEGGGGGQAFGLMVKRFITTQRTSL